MKKVHRWLALVLMAPALGACGQSVTILSIHDQRLPAESRRWIADAEDGVAVATALRDRAEYQLEETHRWRSKLRSTIDWQGGGGQAEGLLKQLIESRVKLAEYELDKAELALELALSKQRKINAETAMRHDLTVYDLKPIREETDAVRARLRTLGVTIDNHRVALEKLSSSWWEAYATYMQSSNNNSVMWIEPKN